MEEVAQRRVYFDFATRYPRGEFDCRLRKSLLMHPVEHDSLPHSILSERPRCHKMVPAEQQTLNPTKADALRSR